MFATLEEAVAGLEVLRTKVPTDEEISTAELEGKWNYDAVLNAVMEAQGQE